MRRFILLIGLLWSLSASLWATEIILQRALLGDNLTLSSLKGKWVYINYWANWCQPCLEEIAAFNQFYEKYKNKNIAIFGVNYDGLPINEQIALIKQAGLHYPSLLTDPAAALKLGDIRAVPVTFIFDPTGKLHDVRYGKQTMESLSNVL
jgi:thiol-disulfide isomerase/thioredoxin